MTKAVHQNRLQWLGSPDGISHHEFGSKAATLDKLGRSLRVAKGFVVDPSLASSIANGDAQAVELRALQSAFQVLCTAGTRVVVRSSSLHEDKLDHQFAGIFDSILNVQSYDELIAAIRAVYASGLSARAQNYSRNLGINLSTAHIAVLVQQQIDTQLSGLAQDRSTHMHAEFWKGHLAGGARGLKKPDFVQIVHYVARKDDTVDSGTRSSVSQVQLRELKRAMQDAVAIVGKGCVIEFGFKGDSIWIFQARPYKKQGADFRKALSTKHGGNLKAAAMEYFSRSGLFTRPLALIAPDTSDQEVRKIIRSTEFGSNSITVRFAHGEEIGLPRFFCKSKAEATEKIIDSRLPSWSSIAHDYINLRRSFELLVGKNEALLEHVTGMWESNTQATPDQLLISGRTYSAVINTSRNSATTTDIEGARNLEMPAPNDRVCRFWMKRIGPILEKIRQDFDKYLPLNFHFIEDDECRWIFLNIRAGFELPNTVPAPKSLFRITEIGDLKKWDGERPVLVSVRLNRGDEHSLATLAQELARRGACVYTEFGLLSHPAMVMREYGVTVHQLQRKAAAKSRLRTQYEGSLDGPNDWLDRIKGEPKMHESRELVTVKDRAPIVRDHCLVVAKRDVKSLAELSTSELVAEVKRLEGTLGNFLFLEKGRLSICTSSVRAHHAHAHILPIGRGITAVLDRIRKIFEITTDFANIESAYAAARAMNGPYIIFGSPRLRFQVAIIGNDETLVEAKIVYALQKCFGRGWSGENRGEK